MAAALQPITTMLDGIDARLDRMEAKQGNASKCDDADVLVPPKRGNADPPLEAPRTIAALKAIDVNNLTIVENYYGLPHNGTLSHRKKQLGKEYGMNIFLFIPLSVPPSSILV